MQDYQLLITIKLDLINESLFRVFSESRRLARQYRDESKTLLTIKGRVSISVENIESNQSPQYLKVKDYAKHVGLPQERIRNYIINSEAGRIDFPYMPWSPLMIPVAKADKWLDNNPYAIPIRGLKSKRPQRNKKEFV